MSLRGDVLAQPAGYESAAAANLPAANSRAQAQSPDPAFGHRVETFGEKVPGGGFRGIGVRERIARSGLSHLFVLHTQPRSAERVTGRDWTVRMLAAYLAEVFRGSGGKSACRWMSFQSPSMRR